MFRKIVVGGVTLVALLAVLPLVGAQEQVSLADLDVRVPLELNPKERMIIPLNQDHLVVAGVKPGETQEIAVRLRETAYEGRVLKIRRGKATVWHGWLDCYELDSDTPYTWAVWSVPAGHFRLFSNGSGENYLAWVALRYVEVAEVSQARDRCVALSQPGPLGAPDAVLVPVCSLIPEVDFAGRNALYLDINVVSAGKDEAGNWVVKVMAPKSDQVFTLVCEKGEWRRE
jgi:hypothetical protein